MAALEWEPVFFGLTCLHTADIIGATVQLAQSLVKRLVTTSAQTAEAPDGCG